MSLFLQISDKIPLGVWVINMYPYIFVYDFLCMEYTLGWGEVGDAGWLWES